MAKKPLLLLALGILLGAGGYALYTLGAQHATRMSPADPIEIARDAERKADDDAPSRTKKFSTGTIRWYPAIPSTSRANRLS